MTVAPRACLAITVAAVASCAYSREGWGHGRYFVVSEAATLQVRRSSVRVEDTTGDLVMNWIGARAPTGSPPIASLTVTVFEDLDGDLVPDPAEIRAQREAHESGTKILFSDVRVTALAARSTLRARVETRTASGESKASMFTFEPDR